MTAKIIPLPRPQFRRICNKCHQPGIAHPVHIAGDLILKRAPINCEQPHWVDGKETKKCLR